MLNTKSLSSCLFFSGLLLGMIITLSSNSWLGAWVGLELNMMAFLPLLNSGGHSVEGMIKYFMTQALASQLLLLGGLSVGVGSFFLSLIMSGLAIKLGAAPFHVWYPSVAQSLGWGQNLILMVIQKLAPLHLFAIGLSVGGVLFSGMIILFSCIVGGLGGLNQSQLRKLMAYSSINHLGWVLSAMMVSSALWMKYYFVYSYMSIFLILMFLGSSVVTINQLWQVSPFLSASAVVGLLSLGGLPPFLGFVPKWMVIMNMLQQGGYLLSVILVMSTLISLYFYIRMMWGLMSIMFNNLNEFWGEGGSGTLMVNVVGLGLAVSLFSL